MSHLFKERVRFTRMIPVAQVREIEAWLPEHCRGKHSLSYSIPQHRGEDGRYYVFGVCVAFECPDEAFWFKMQFV